ncbi:ead/Ea22-like family protein [Escherichia coli]
MSKIDYQALREAAERAIPAMDRLLMLPVDDDLISEQELKDSGVDIDALNAFKFLAGPETVLTLLDESNALEETRINDVCRIAELTKQLESVKLKLNEQREYFEGVIADGSKRIAALEEIATDYALKFQKAQDALKYAALMHNNSLSFEKEVRRPTSERGTFTVQIPNPKEYFINGVFQPLRYERDVERAIIKAGGKVS